MTDKLRVLVAGTGFAGKGHTEQCWQVLVHHFVRDIQGHAVSSHPTFTQGAQYQQIIDTIRTTSGLVDAPIVLTKED